MKVFLQLAVKASEILYLLEGIVFTVVKYDNSNVSIECVGGNLDIFLVRLFPE